MKTLEINEEFEIDGKIYKINECLELDDVSDDNDYALCEDDIYYYINEHGLVYVETFKGVDWDFDKLQKTGNVYLTREEAEFEVEKRKIIAKIKKWKRENDNDYKFNDENINHYISYSHLSSDSYITYDKDLKKFSNFLYFSSEEKAKKCLKFIGKENWEKYILEVEE